MTESMKDFIYQIKGMDTDSINRAIKYIYNQTTLDEWG